MVVVMEVVVAVFLRVMEVATVLFPVMKMMVMWVAVIE
jgi:hypothetical protein